MNQNIMKRLMAMLLCLTMLSGMIGVYAEDEITAEQETVAGQTAPDQEETPVAQPQDEPASSEKDAEPAACEAPVSEPQAEEPSAANDVVEAEAEQDPAEPEAEVPSEPEAEATAEPGTEAVGAEAEPAGAEAPEGEASAEVEPADPEQSETEVVTPSEPDPEATEEAETEPEEETEAAALFSCGYALASGGAVIYTSAAMTEALGELISGGLVYVSSRKHVDGAGRDAMTVHFAVNGEAVSGYVKAALITEISDEASAEKLQNPDAAYNGNGLLELSFLPAEKNDGDEAQTGEGSAGEEIPDEGYTEEEILDTNHPVEETE